MSNNKLKIKEEMKTLKDLESELEELLSIIKPSDKLRVWDEFIVEKDILLPGWHEILEWSVIIILSILKWGKWHTDEIKYKIKQWEKKSMSKWIFMGFFCKSLISQEEDLNRRIDKLKKEIKEENHRIKWSKVLDQSEKVQKKVHFLLKFVRSFKKAVKK